LDQRHSSLLEILKYSSDLSVVVVEVFLL